MRFFLVSVLEIDNWKNGKYNVISLLNLLDRIDHPLQLLNDVKSALDPSGLVVVAIVLPYNPGVETGKTVHVNISEMTLR